MNEKFSERELTYQMLLQVIREEKPSHVILFQALETYGWLDRKSRAFISRLFRGVLENDLQLRFVIGCVSSVPVRKMKTPVRVILEMGVFQILYMDHVPDRAACNEAVSLAKRHGLTRLSGFVNAVLRAVSAKKKELEYPDPGKDPVSFLRDRYSLPAWIGSVWIRRFGYEKTLAMAQAALADHPLTVRIRRESGRAGILEDLAAAGAGVQEGRFMPCALRLTLPCAPDRLLPLQDGRLAVQDESAMLSAVCADPHPGDHVIDVCAAPGGKSIQLSDIMGGKGLVSARDISPAKVAMIEENLARMGGSCVQAMCMDALQRCPEDVGTADVVMADLPCSGLGVMGRKPDIKLSMNEDKIHQLAELQRQILAVVSSYVKPGGTLLYSTCTVSLQENEENAAWLCSHFPFHMESLNPFLPEMLRSREAESGSLQILPGQYGSDGFFLARLIRDREEESR